MSSTSRGFNSDDLSSARAGVHRGSQTTKQDMPSIVDFDNATVTGFVESVDYKKAKEMLYEHQTLMLTGIQGIGKRSIGIKLANDMRQIPSPYVHYIIDCSSTENFVSSISQLDGQLSGDGNRTLADLISILDCEPYINHRKFLIFTNIRDMQMFEISVEKIVEDTISSSSHRQQWWIIETMTFSLQRRQCLSMTGFSMSEMREYFRGLPSITPEQQKQLHHYMGGHPFALSMARNYLKKERCNVNQYMTQLTTFAKNHLKENARQDLTDTAGNNILCVIGETIKRELETVYAADAEKLKVLRNALKVLSLFDGEHVLTEAMIVSCMEGIPHQELLCDEGPAPESAERRSHTSKLMITAHEHTGDLLNLLTQILLAKHDGRGKKVKITLSVMAAMRLIYHPPSDAVLLICRQALLTMIRVMDPDGRWHSSSEQSSCHLVQAIKLAVEVRDIRSRYQSGFNSTLKIMFAEILLLIGYSHLANRDVEKGKESLMEALDVFCDILALNKFDEEFGGIQSLDVQNTANKLHEKAQMLAEPLSDENDEADLVEYIDKVPLFRKLSRRDRAVLSVQDSQEYQSAPGQADIQNDHLTPEALQRCREEQKALTSEVLRKIFISERLSSLLYLLSRHYSFCISSFDNQNMMKHCHSWAELAEIMYHKTEEMIPVDQGERAIFLGHVMVRRELLAISLIQLEEDKPRTPPCEQTAKRLKDILKNIDELEAIAGKSFEFGLQRTSFPGDAYHKLLCGEKRMNVHGLQAFNGDAHASAKALKLYNDFINRGGNKKQLAYTHQKYAHCLDLAQDPQQATVTMVKAMMSFAAYSDNDDSSASAYAEVTKGYFKELCDDIDKYNQKCSEITELPLDKENYLRKVTLFCQESGISYCADILKNVCQKAKVELQQPQLSRKRQFCYGCQKWDKVEAYAVSKCPKCDEKGAMCARHEQEHHRWNPEHKDSCSSINSVFVQPLPPVASGRKLVYPSSYSSSRAAANRLRNPADGSSSQAFSNDAATDSASTSSSSVV